MFGRAELNDHIRLAGTAGLAVSNQIFNRFKAAGKPLNPSDVAVVDAAEYHHYQVRFLDMTPQTPANPFATPSISQDGKSPMPTILYHHIKLSTLLSC